MLEVSESHPGTPEDAWLLSPLLTSPMLNVRPHGRVVVIAPHPDDEVLAVGGTMVNLANAGAAIDVVAVTDGEASHPRSRTSSREEMAARRDHERQRALELLGISNVRVIRMGQPDGAVSFRLATELGIFLSRHPDVTTCIAPWEHDGHPDHDACGMAAKAACGALGIPLLQYPVWTWHWASPQSPEFPWSRVRLAPLSHEVRKKKRAAVKAYQSQIAPLSDAPGDEANLPPAVLARFSRPFEVFFA